MTHRIFATALAAIAAVSIVSMAQNQPDRNKTVFDAYPRLAMGVLTFAKVGKLPDGLILRSGTTEIHADDVNTIIASQPDTIREDLKNNAHLIVDQLATRGILGKVARDAAKEDPNSANQPDASLINSYIEKTVLAKVTVSESDAKQFYEEQKGTFGEATFEQAKASIEQYLVGQKKQQAVNAYIRDLGKAIPIEISDSWLADQDKSARANPVDQARDSGKPSFVDFGADGCAPCEMMTPIIEDLTNKYAGKMNVLFVHVREKQILAARYGIQAIPIQVIFDKAGVEVFRHVGFWPQAEIEKKLVEMGVK
jgi:thioredoxin 1